uniref:Uncharacterized protein n=1 Tax=Oryza brachyantha TaxID=4533 RepID=J3N3U5_ORYBR
RGQPCSYELTLTFYLFQNPRILLITHGVPGHCWWQLEGRQHFEPQRNNTYINRTTTLSTRTPASIAVEEITVIAMTSNNCQ